MLIDFCHHAVGSKIRCDKVSHDGYEVTNLVAEDATLKRTGFMVERFIKPPVNITLQFPCNISIYRIVVDPVIGQQQSCDLKIFTASVSVHQSWLYKNEKSGSVSTDGVLFNFVGSTSQRDPAVTCFENASFKKRYAWNFDNIPDCSSYPVRHQLSNRKFSALSEVSHVSFTVSKAKEGKTVAIKRIEIWGAPSQKVPSVLQNMLKSVFLQALHPDTSRTSILYDKSKDEATDVETTTTNARGDHFLVDGDNVPEDFVDEITCDVMSVPMLLPSGKNIDLYTLERFINTEASWGRAPSDPFTGLAFTSERKAVTNTALKARIDQFVFENSATLKNVSRTLGSGEQLSAKLKPSSLLGCDAAANDKACVKRNIRKLDNAAACDSYFHAVNTQTSLMTTAKHEMDAEGEEKHFAKRRKFTESCRCVNRDPECVCQRKTITTSTTVCRANNFTVNYTSSSINSKSLTHGEQLSQSLNDALASTLNSLPSFTSVRKPNLNENSQTERFHCCRCKRDCNTSTVVKYKLPCEHTLCRECLQQMTGRLVCSTCSKIFKSDQILRVFN